MRRRTFVVTLVNCSTLAFVTAQSGCGTILHSDRIDAKRSNQIDWKVAALDGLGLLLFFIPGVVAFIVDFYTGAIYLPSNQVASKSAQPQFDRRDVPVGELNLSRIEQIVSNSVGRDVLLDESSRLSPLASIDQYQAQVQRHESDHSFGHLLGHYFVSRSDAKKQSS